MTGLHLAAYFGLENVTSFLLNSNVPESRDSYSRTPLSWAAENGHEATVKLLLEKGADIESKERFGKTPLPLAANRGHEAVVKLLLEKGAEINLKDKTPLLWATRNGHEAVIE